MDAGAEALALVPQLVRSDPIPQLGLIRSFNPGHRLEFPDFADLIRAGGNLNFDLVFRLHACHPTVILRPTAPKFIIFHHFGKKKPSRFFKELGSF
jgi:hypothetical protein